VASIPPQQPTGWIRPTWRSRQVEYPDPQYAPYSTTSPPTYFWLSLACTLLFFPMGLVAVAYSILVTRRSQSGDVTGAAKASHLARTWCLATLVAFTVIAVVVGVTGVHA
jgi:hypothetical protein